MPLQSRTKVLFLPVIRGFYDRELTKTVKNAMRAAAETLGVDGIFPDDDAYTEGLIFRDQDVHAYYQAWKRDMSEIKAVLAFSSDFMWERSIQDTVRLLPEDVPVFLIVNNDVPEAMVNGETITDTLCGSISAAYNVRMLGRRILRTHRIDMTNAAVLQDALQENLQLADGIAAMTGMRIAMLGVNPSPFATTFVNQLEIFRVGMSLHTYELLDMWGDVMLGGETVAGRLGDIDLVNPIAKDDPRLPELRVGIEQLSLQLPATESLDVTLRCFLWLRDRYQRDFIDTGALHCWPEFKRFFGVNACTFAMLADVLLQRPLVCEVDVCHAIMCRLASALTGEPGVILDVNNNGWDPRVFNVFHCSQTPVNWLNDGTLREDGFVQGTICATPFTAVSAATTHDSFEATVFTGHFLSENPGIRGSSGWAFVPNMEEVLHAFETRGMHHFVAMKGCLPDAVADVLQFKGLNVLNAATTVPDLDEIELDLPKLEGSGACSRYHC